MSAFRLKPAEETEFHRTIDIGKGVEIKLRWDALSAWDIATTTLRGRVNLEQRAAEFIRLAAEYGLGWNVLDENDQPVPFSGEGFVQAINQEPGFLLAFYLELAELSGEAYAREKKASARWRSGTSPEASADTASDAGRPNSHAPEAYVGPTEASART